MLLHESHETFTPEMKVLQTLNKTDLGCANNEELRQQNQASICQNLIFKVLAQ